MSQHIEWLNLIDRSGAFLEPGVLDDALPQGLEGVDSERRRNLLSAYDEWREAVDACDADAEALHRAWIDFVLKTFLEYDDRALRRGESVPESLSLSVAEHGGSVRPGMAVMKGDSPQLLIDVLPPDTDLESIRSYEGWNTSALDRMIALCRGAKVTIGLVTNGERWLVVHVPEGGTVGHASWYGRIWRPEPLTLRAFQTLLGVRRCFGPQDKTLPALLSASLEYQDEVTDTLGQQVRRAVEVLIQSLDRADHDRHGELLRDVEPRELYEAGLTVMMRLVFLMCAEERGLLLLGEGIYDQNYAISTLRSELREWQSRHGDQVLERRHDAWSRLLATFRAVFGGVAHETLRMPALGGSLFDPDRFPFLEGRPKGSSWRQSVAAPLPIDNRTVLLLLSSLQVLEQRRGARLLSYKALDVEQIGHVYEGLLECTVQRLPEITLGLEGASSAKDPNISLVDLERAQQGGEATVLALLTEVTGRTESALRRAMGREVEEAFESRLLMACGSDTGLLRRVKPWANLLRKDIWDHPLVYRKDAFAVALGSDRRETGTHYTPKSLTERIVQTTLEPLVYVGPSDGKPREVWTLRTPHELLDLKVCDPAMGSGAFLVQVCRYLGDRLVESWGIQEASGKAITVDGEVVESLGSSESMPSDPEERVILARRLVAERCLYGVDINPMAVELAKLSIWLVTLAKGRPFGFLDHNLKYGDSLLGILRLEQLTKLSMNPPGHCQLRLFGQNIEQAVGEAIELRSRLRKMHIRDIRDVEAMANLDADAHRILELSGWIADALIGEVFAAGHNGATLENALAWLSVQAEQAIDGDVGALSSMRQRSVSALSLDLNIGSPTRRPFHWPLEFPEVFCRSSSGFDALVFNPPFMGGTKISGRHGSEYLRFIKSNFISSQNTDFCAYFVQRVMNICSIAGNFGFLATKTIAQADTREASLDLVTKEGAIYFALTSIPWPGQASVVVSILAASRARSGVKSILNNQTVEFIDSFLSAEALFSGKPKKLITPAPSFKGVMVVGTGGFCVSPEQEQQYLIADENNKGVIKLFLGGSDIMQNIGSTPTRTIIDFVEMPIEEARRYKEPFWHVERHVRPLREQVNRKAHRDRWWQYGDVRQGMRKAIAGFDRVLVSGQTVKYLAFVWCPSNWVFDQKCVVIATDRNEHFSILNSALFDSWARALCATLGETLSFAPSDAYETFPWPGQLTELEPLGRRLDEVRFAASTARQRCLTDTYNVFHSQQEPVDSIIQALRDAHVAIDVAVARAYGWTDIILGHGFHEVPYLSASDRIRFTISETARVEVLRRLSELNQQSYEKELARVPHANTVSRLANRAPRTERHTSVAAVHPPLDFEAVSEMDFNTATPAFAISNFLRSHPGWHAKADILKATGIMEGHWSVVISDLVASGAVERQGERRGARYSAKSLAEADR